MKTFIIILIIIILGIGIWFLVQPSSSQTYTPSLSPGAYQPSNTSPTASLGNINASVKSFTITGNNYAFTPNEIRVKEGDTVALTFVDSGGTHNLTVNGFNQSTQTLQNGGQGTIQFVANKKGTFQFYCSVDGHRDLGMTGNLIVQ